jgi:RHS repeat-associated protein
MLVGDFNGDGKSDIYCHRPPNDSTNIDLIALSNGSGLNAWSWGSPNSYSTCQILVGDFNGDGKSDIYCHRPQTDTTAPDLMALSNGAGLNGWSWASPNSYSSCQILLGDFNGDGAQDIYCNRYQGSASVDLMALSNREVLNDWSWGSPNSYSSCQMALGDFNGDGKSDLYCNRYPNDTSGDLYAFSSGPKDDYATQVTSPLGGTTSVTYVPSSVWPNANRPPLSETVSSISINDGHVTSTTSYSYSGGLWEPVKRWFLGFAYERATLPCDVGVSACPTRETWFAQDYGSITKPTRTDLVTGSGFLMSSTLNQFTTNAVAPYTSQLTGVWSYLYDGTGGTACPGVNCKRSYTQLEYDSYGNVWQQIDYGNYDVIGDEKTTVRYFAPNTSAYIVSAPGAVSLYAGVGTSGTLLSDALYYYDGASSYDVAPTKGDATSALSWLDTTNNWVTKTSAYDAYGNATSHSDELGNTTRYSFDGTYHELVTSTTNALGQSVSVTWDATCGAPLTATDLNGVQSSIQYDALCRVVSKTLPLGGFENHAYVSMGDPSSQYVEIDTPSADGNGNQWTRQYLDGRGRTWLTLSKGPSASQDIYAQVAYEPRSGIASQTLPYYAGAAAAWTSFTYDVLERTTGITNADGTHRTPSYSLWTTTQVDELGHSQSDTRDAYGHVVTHQEVVGSETSTTTFTYNLLGQLTRTVDPSGNVTTAWFDSLGRKTSQTDPDMGTWSYTYDAAGHMLSMTDAKGQKTTFTYDALGRARSKTLLAGTASASTVTWTYDQARSGYANVGHLTTMTDDGGTEVTSFDAAGRPVETVRTISGTSYTFTNGYDAGGRVLWRTYPDGDSVGTSASPILYDGAGRTKVLPGVVTYAAYDASGNLTSQTNANGTVTTRSYSATRNWLNTILTTAGSVTLQKLSYTRDAEGKISSITSPFPDESWTYTYDDLHRLTSAVDATTPGNGQSMTYDLIGNVTSNTMLGTYSYPAAGQPRPHAVLSAGADTFTYDANGNMLSGGYRTYTYDGANRPITINSTDYLYDGNGRRLERSFWGTTVAYPAESYEVSIAPSSTTSTEYISLSGHLVAKRSGGTTTWLHEDALGSVQVTTNGAGALVERETYGATGSRIAGGTDDSLGFTGSGQDDDTGLIYLNARYYAPVLYRFVTPDTVVPHSGTVGLNRYAYANDSPVTFADPGGHDPGDDGVSNDGADGVGDPGLHGDEDSNAFGGDIAGSVHIGDPGLHSDEGYATTGPNGFGDGDVRQWDGQVQDAENDIAARIGLNALGAALQSGDLNVAFAGIRNPAPTAQDQAAFSRAVNNQISVVFGNDSGLLGGFLGTVNPGQVAAAVPTVHDGLQMGLDVNAVSFSNGVNGMTATGQTLQSQGYQTPFHDVMAIAPDVGPFSTGSTASSLASAASGTTTMMVNDRDYALNASAAGLINGVSYSRVAFANAGFNVIGAGSDPSAPTYHSIAEYSGQIARSYSGVDRGFHN